MDEDKLKMQAVMDAAKALDEAVLDAVRTGIEVTLKLQTQIVMGGTSGPGVSVNTKRISNEMQYPGGD